MTLREALEKVPDPRSRHGRRRPLRAILALSVCAMMSGARSLYAISQWGRPRRRHVARIGEKSVGDKGGELGALRRLLGELDIEGRVVTGWSTTTILAAPVASPRNVTVIFSASI